MTSEKIYHIINRGANKCALFKNNADYHRFIYDLFVFNDDKKISNAGIFFKNTGLQNHYLNYAREPLVTLHAFCLMPNHYHLLMSEIHDNGISRFMQKLNAGYAKYFNQRCERTGVLFESRYKRVIIEQNSHFIHIPYYIHCNPLDMAFPEWRERRLIDPDEAWKFLANYPWSSHLDYAGTANFPSVTDRRFFLSFFEGEVKYKEAMKAWLASMKSDVSTSELLRGR